MKVIAFPLEHYVKIAVCVARWKYKCTKVIELLLLVLNRIPFMNTNKDRLRNSDTNKDASALLTPCLIALS
jgi:hypothetical protein